MRIKGENFYDMVTHEIVEFSARDVDVVYVQHCEIKIIDVNDMSIVDTEYLYVVTVIMQDGSLFAAEPFENKEYADFIAETLAQYCEDVAHGN